MKFIVKHYPPKAKVTGNVFAYTSPDSATRAAARWNKTPPTGQWWNFTKGWSYPEQTWCVQLEEENEWGKVSL